jgi:hypothetical protein
MTIRTQEKARKLALDFIAFKLELERAKRPNDVVSILTDKSCAAYRAVMNKRKNVARKLIEEVLDLSVTYKPRYEKDAIQIIRLTNLAGEVVRGLKNI